MKWMTLGLALLVWLNPKAAAGADDEASRIDPGAARATRILWVHPLFFAASEALPVLLGHAGGDIDLPPIPPKLQRTLPDVSPEDNGYVMLQNLPEGLFVELRDVAPQEVVLAYEYQGEPLPPAMVRTWLAANAEALAYFQTAFAKPEFFYPERITLDSVAAGLSEVTEFSRLLASTGPLEELSSPQRLEIVDGLFEASARVRQMGLLISLLTGLAFEESAYTYVLGQAELTTDTVFLAKLQASLAGRPEARTGFREVLQGEFDGLRAFLLANTESLDPAFLSIRSSGRAIQLRYSYKPHLTLSQMTEFFEEWTDATQLSGRAVFDALPELPAFGTREALRQGLREGNAYGTVVQILLLPEPQLITAIAFDREFKGRALEAAIALRRYQLEHGAWPETLEALVPDYLEAVPRDPFDESRPLNYDRERRMIWSIGKDFVDEGGVYAEDDDGNPDTRPGFSHDTAEPTLILPQWPDRPGPAD